MCLRTSLEMKRDEMMLEPFSPLIFRGGGVEAGL